MDVSLLQQLQEQLSSSLKAISEQLVEPEASESPSPRAKNGSPSPFFDEKPEKFELQANGVPMLTISAPKRHSMFSSKSSVSSQVTLDDGTQSRLLDEWREKFVVSQQEAMDMYGEMHRLWARHVIREVFERDDVTRNQEELR